MLALGALATLAAASYGQNGYAVNNGYVKDDNLTDTVGNSFNVKANVDTSWTESDDNFFFVFGDSADDGLPWTLVFAHVCANEWTSSQGFRRTFDHDGSVQPMKNYYHEHGTETITPGTGSATNASRRVNSYVINYFYYIYTPAIPSGGGGD